MRKLLTAASALSLIVAPMAAQASERQPSPAAAKDDLAGIGTLWVLAGLAVIAVAVILIADNNHHHPASP